MARLTNCSACEIGDHEHHVRVVQAVPEGMMGGAVCPCKGECAENAAERREKFLSRLGMTPAVRKAMRRAR